MPPSIGQTPATTRYCYQGSKPTGVTFSNQYLPGQARIRCLLQECPSLPRLHRSQNPLRRRSLLTCLRPLPRRPCFRHDLQLWRTLTAPNPRLPQQHGALLAATVAIRLQPWRPCRVQRARSQLTSCATTTRAQSLPKAEDLSVCFNRGSVPPLTARPSHDIRHDSERDPGRAAAD